MSHLSPYLVISYIRKLYNSWPTIFKTNPETKEEYYYSIFLTSLNPLADKIKHYLMYYYYKEYSSHFQLKNA